MKTINVKPVESIKIQLNDKTYICSFNMLSMAYIQECFQELGDMKLGEVSPARMASILLYCGIRANDDEITQDEARALAMQMGPANYGDIIGMFNSSMMDSMDDKDSKALKKLIAQTLNSVRKK